ncbi:MAG: PadR family transcriptional regulator [Candidatus Thorarchaeota archaeon]|jgi:DNA-binding PadR family transcriptional regulator
MTSRDRVRDQILMFLDRKPCHGYELRRLLLPIVGDVEITKLYRWLRDMEKQGLIDGSDEEGPHGPSRRTYQLGPRGERQLRNSLRHSMSMVLHFYDAFRQYSMRQTYGSETEFEFEKVQGKTVASIVSPFLAAEDELIKVFSNRLLEKRLDIVGISEPWEKTGIQTSHIDGTLNDISSKSDIYMEMWLIGMPPRSLLPRIAMEARRILKNEGVLRLVAPFAFFDEPESATIESFFRLTASQMFPELGVVEGPEICSVFQKIFGDCKVIEFHPGFVEFYATNP